MEYNDMDGERNYIDTVSGSFEWISKSRVPENLPEEYNSVGMLTGGLLGTEDDFKLLIEKFVNHPVGILEKDLQVVIDSVEKFPGVVGDMFVKLQYKQFNDSSSLTCIPGRNPLGLEEVGFENWENIFYDSSEFMMVKELEKWCDTDSETLGILVICGCCCCCVILPIIIWFFLSILFIAVYTGVRLMWSSVYVGHQNSPKAVVKRSVIEGMVSVKFVECLVEQQLEGVCKNKHVGDVTYILWRNVRWLFGWMICSYMIMYVSFVMLCLNLHLDLEENSTVVTVLLVSIGVNILVELRQMFTVKVEDGSIIGFSVK
eukprot:UN01924